MKMLDTLSRYPQIAVASGFGTTFAKLANLLTGPLEFIIMVGTAVVVVLTAILKFREVFKKDE